MKSLGFTNRLCVYILCLLIIIVFFSFYLAVESIDHEYTGALACWTACIVPVGTGLDIVLTAAVKKSQAENQEGGINYLKYVSRGDEEI